MTLPDLPAARKPPNRWWLFGPYIALVLVIVVWSGAWIWLRGQVGQRLDQIAAQGAVHGPSVIWSHRSISGYPFRMLVVLDNVRAAEPSGWGVAAPQIRAESYAYDLKHWVAYAPKGVTLSRPRGGPVAVSGQAIRASLALLDEGRSRVSLEGLKLVFATRPGDKPFPLASAEHLDAHTRPAVGVDTVEFLVQLQGARFPADSLLGRVAGAAPASSAWHGTLSQASALAGRDWPDMARAWGAAGGSITILAADLDAGPAHLNASGGTLAVGADGRLNGALQLGLAHTAQSLAAIGAAGGLDPALARGGGEIAQARATVSPTAKADLTFQAGVTTFGPLAIGPAPKVY